MKAGLFYADAITTVSPTYAAEIQTPEFGCGFDGLLRARAGRAARHPERVGRGGLGPLDGPAPARPVPQGPSAQPAEVQGGAAGRARAGPGGAGPLFGIVSRLTGQKGMDLVLAALPDLLAAGGQLAVLGTGEPALEDAFRDAQAAHPGQLRAVIGYDEALSHQVVAGVDALLVPSRFEPCGLTQMMAMRYGALPLVTRVGGLADTVVDANTAALRAGVATGFVADPDAAGVTRAVQRATPAVARSAGLAGGAARRHGGRGRLGPVRHPLRRAAAGARFAGPLARYRTRAPQGRATKESENAGRAAGGQHRDGPAQAAGQPDRTDRAVRASLDRASVQPDAHA